VVYVGVLRTANDRHRRRRSALTRRNVSTVLLVMFLFCGGLLFAAEKGPVTVSPKDKCPVCGMFVKKYPDWTMQMLFKDGSYAVFDGAKDLFKYYFDMKKFGQQRKVSDIDAILVFDYYRVAYVDGYRAYYVIGSDVYGPMGKELIPFEKKEDALEFMKDHKGQRTLTFKEITPEIVKSLDR
jgi:copper chaperone NosL